MRVRARRQLHCTRPLCRNRASRTRQYQETGSSLPSQLQPSRLLQSTAQRGASPPHVCRAKPQSTSAAVHLHAAHLPLCILLRDRGLAPFHQHVHVRPPGRRAVLRRPSILLHRLHSARFPNPGRLRTSNASARRNMKRFSKCLRRAGRSTSRLTDYLLVVVCLTVAG